MRFVIVILICFLSACKSDTAVLDRIETLSKSEDCFQCIKRLSENECLEAKTMRMPSLF